MIGASPLLVTSRIRTSGACWSDYENCERTIYRVEELSWSLRIVRIPSIAAAL